jgi:mRNA interferase MazF
MARVPTPNRGEIWLVDFDPAVGAEIRKSRPALVVGLDSIGRLPLRIVVPITDWKPQYAALPWFVQLRSTAASGPIKDSGADAFQVKSVAIAVCASDRNGYTAELDLVASAIALRVGAP